MCQLQQGGYETTHNNRVGGGGGGGGSGGGGGGRIMWGFNVCGGIMSICSFMTIRYIMSIMRIQGVYLGEKCNGSVGSRVYVGE